MVSLRFLPASISNRISASRARSLVDAGALLLDVDRTGEWRVCHPLGAMHVSLEELADSIVSLSAERRPIVTVCNSGVAAATAARMLVDRGFTAYSMRGGLDEWEAAGGLAWRDGQGQFAEEDR